MATLEQYLLEFQDSAPFWMEENRIAFLSNRSGYTQLWEKNLLTGSVVQRTFFENTVLQAFAAPASRKLFFVADPDGSEAGQPYVLGYDDDEPVLLLNEPRYYHLLLGAGPDGEVLYYISNEGNGILSALYSYDLKTGKKQPVYDPATANIQPAGVSPDGRYLLYNELKSYDDDRLFCYDTVSKTVNCIPGDTRASSESRPSWSPDGKTVYVCTNRDRDLPYIAGYDLEKDRLTPVYCSGKGECRRAILSPDGRYLAVSVSEEGFGRIDLLDAADYHLIRSVEPIRAALGAADARTGYFSWSSDSRCLLFALANGTHPSRLWMHDVPTGRSEMITGGGLLEEQDMVEADLCEYLSFDGLRIPYFLYLPRRLKKKTDLPVMIEIHGGPESQHYCCYDPYIQYMVSRGVTVAAPNIRGSGGYGKAYCHLDDREKRLDCVKDIEALVKHLVDCGLADPKRIAVSGISYGGFMVLSCCARLPDLWACAIDKVGMYNLETFIRNTSSYRRAWRATEYGSLEDGDLLYSVSPAAKAECMKTPMVVVHGDNDPRVPVSETEQLVNMLRSKGVEVDFLRYGDEGHVLKKYPNILHSTTRITEFLLKYLKPEMC